MGAKRPKFSSMLSALPHENSENLEFKGEGQRHHLDWEMKGA